MRRNKADGVVPYGWRGFFRGQTGTGIMKKTRRAIARILILLSITGAGLIIGAGSAAAEDGPTGGMIGRKAPAEITEEAPSISEGVMRILRGTLLAGSTFTGPTACTTGQKYCWTLTDGSGTAETNYYQISVAIMDGSYADPEMSDIQYLPPKTQEKELTYTFYFPGNYIIYADAFASESAVYPIYTKYIRVTVADGGENEATRMIDEVAAACKTACAEAADDYTMALWLHDWVIDHCIYDSEEVWFSADSLLLHGTGVCNSYTRAYALLLEKVGIACRRVAGYTNGNSSAGHAWIAAEMNGKWYLIDPTWDDRTGAFLRHAYFAVSDELMSINHTALHYAGGQDQPSCTSLDDNWFVHEGTWQEYASAILTEYRERMQTGWHRFRLEAPAYSGSKYIRTMQGTVTAYGMSLTEWEDSGGKIYTGEFRYEYDERTQKGFILGKHHSAGTLEMPEGMKMIDAESFANTGANIVVIRDGCETIGDGAFAGMDIWELTAEADDMAIDPAAFDQAFIYVIANPDSTMAAYAEARGWMVGDGTDFEETGGT